MNIDTRIYGYVGDGFLACPSCAEEIAKDAHESQFAADDIPAERDDYIPTLADYELADLRPLHSYDDTTPCGETCDCGAEIFEEADDHGLDGACSSCGYEVPALWAVVTDDHRRIVLARFQTENEAEDDLYDRLTGPDKHPPLKVHETADELYPGIGGRIPGPGEVALPGLATV